MAWDSSRPVPWQRLLREWLLYVVIMVAVFLLLFRNSPINGIIVGLALSGPLYLLIGYVMAKLGYERKSPKERRAALAARKADERDSTTAGASSAKRNKPAPTRRTNAPTGTKSSGAKSSGKRKGRR